MHAIKPKHPNPMPLPGGPPDEKRDNPTHLPVEPDDGGSTSPVVPEDEGDTWQPPV